MFPISNTIQMVLTNPKHIDHAGQMQKNPDSARTSDTIAGRKFGDLLFDSLGRVSDSQFRASEIFEQMIAQPDEVEIHEVTAAMATAEMSMNLTKAVADRVVQAYKDIIAMR